MDRIYRKLYGEHWLLFHVLFMVIINFIVYFIMNKIDIPLSNMIKLINFDIISLSATIAGFEFAGVSILISLEGNKKLKAIKDIGADTILYKTFIYSIVALLISIVFMVLELNVFTTNTISNVYRWSKVFVEFISLLSLEFGFICFFSSMKLISWILK